MDSVRFATTGDPGWASSTVEEWPTRVFDGGPTPTVSEYPESASRALWKSHPPTIYLKTLTFGDRIRSAIIHIALKRSAY